jgi:hypothetical protein
MSKPKKQRTIHCRLLDRATDGALFCSLRVERRGITLNPTPALFFPGPNGEDWQHHAAMGRCEERALRLGMLLRKRWFGV